MVVQEAPPAATTAHATAAGATRAVRRRGATLAWPTGLLLVWGVALAIFAVWLDPHFDYLVDDGLFHTLRAGVFHVALERDGPFFYPRWWPELTMGYGYPLLNFYSPGTYYLAEVFHLLGASTYRAMQLVAVTGVLLGAAGAYGLGAALFRRPLAAVVLAVVYVGSPYPFITNLFNRAAFPEALGLALLPWLLAAATLSVQRRGRLAPLALALTLAALVLVHTLSAFLAAGVLLLWTAAAVVGLPAPDRRAAALSASSGVALGLALCAAFWLPVVAEQRAVQTERGWGTSLSGSVWLFDPLGRQSPAPVSAADERFRTTAGPFDRNWAYPHPPSHVPLPVKPALAQVLFLLLSLGAALSGWLSLRRNRATAGRADERAAPDARSEHAAGAPPHSPSGTPAVGRTARDFSPGPVALCFLLVAGLWFMNTTWSDAVWGALAPFAVLQFPWRLYGPFSLALAVAGTAGFAWLAARGQQQWALAVLLAVFVAVNGRGAAGAAARTRPPDGLPPLGALLRAQENETPGSGTLSGGEFLPRTLVASGPRPPGWSWRDAFDSRYPPGGWIAGRVWPLDPAVDVRRVADAPTRTSARVENAGATAADVAFRTLVFPGWRAYVDGRRVPLRPAPYDPLVDLAPGFAVVSVPPGAHDVQIAFGATPPRTLGTLLTLAGFGAAVLLLLPPSARRRALLPVGGALLLLSGAVLVADLWPLRRPPQLPGAPPETLVLDLAAAGDGTSGHSSAPPEPSPAGGEATLGGVHRRWLAAPAPSALSFDLDVPAGAVFQAGLGVDPASWDDPAASGVRFVVQVTAGGAPAALLDEVLLPSRRPQDRGWRFAEVPLDAYTGQRVTLTLRTETIERAQGPEDATDGAPPETTAPVRAGWATPLVYVDRSGRYPPPAALAPAPDFIPWAQPEPAG